MSMNTLLFLFLIHLLIEWEKGFKVYRVQGSKDARGQVEDHITAINGMHLR
jgi:hypothetical protein